MALHREIASRTKSAEIAQAAAAAAEAAFDKERRDFQAAFKAQGKSWLRLTHFQHQDCVCWAILMVMEA